MINTKKEKVAGSFIRALDRISGLIRDVPALDIYTTPKIMAWIPDESSKMRVTNKTLLEFGIDVLIPARNNKFVVHEFPTNTMEVTVSYFKWFKRTVEAMKLKSWITLKNLPDLTEVNYAN